MNTQKNKNLNCLLSEWCKEEKNQYEEEKNNPYIAVQSRLNNVLTVTIAPATNKNFWSDVLAADHLLSYERRQGISGSCQRL